MKPKTKRIAFVAMVMAVAGGLAGCGRHRRMDPTKAAELAGERLDDLLDGVDATDTQRRQILAIKDRLTPEAIALGTEHARARKEVLAALESPSPDRARLHALVDERTEAMRAFAHKAVDGVIEAQQALTPEQRAKVAKKAHRYSD